MAVETDAAGLEQLARLLHPHTARLDAVMARRLQNTDDPPKLKSLLLITPGAAAQLISSGRTADDFFEQVAYNSRRLAKLNVPPGEVLEVLRAYDTAIRRLFVHRYPKQKAALELARAQLYCRSLLAVTSAYYQVREAETQAFYGLLRAEMDATGLEDLLHRFILILTRIFHAQAGRLIPLTEHPPIASKILHRLLRPRYISGTAGEHLILDPAMRGAYKSYWSIPYFSAGRLAGLVQFGFSTEYHWLPRELDLLHAFAERCLNAAERVRLMRDLAAREEQVRALAGHLLQVEDEERRRLGREVHDEAGQSMLFLRLQLEMLEKVAPADLRPRLAEARAVAERIITEVRRIVAALNPSAVEDLGLPAAIRYVSARFRKLQPVKVRLSLSAYGSGQPRQVETAIYRVVQECYQNIAKYARASRVNLLLRSTDKEVELNIRDDGVGFDVDSAVAQPKSFGLKGMRERIALLGGRLEIRSSPGKGSRISVRLPIAVPSASGSSGDERAYGNSNISYGRSHPVSRGHQDPAFSRTGPGGGGRSRQRGGRRDPGGRTAA